MFDGVACFSPFGAFGYGLYLSPLGGSGFLVLGCLGLSSGTGSDGFEGFDGSDGFEGFDGSGRLNGFGPVPGLKGFEPFFLEASIAFFALSLYS